MYTISKEFAFSAAHQLHGLPPEHPCGRLHGHNYVVRLTLRAYSLDDRGFVVDYGDLKLFQEYINRSLDHRSLNDILDQPSAENLAKHLFDWAAACWPSVVEVAVSETPKTWAAYR